MSATVLSLSAKLATELKAMSVDDSSNLSPSPSLISLSTLSTSSEDSEPITPPPSPILACLKTPTRSFDQAFDWTPTNSLQLDLGPSALPVYAAAYAAYCTPVATAPTNSMYSDDTNTYSSPYTSYASTSSSSLFADPDERYSRSSRQSNVYDAQVAFGPGYNLVQQDSIDEDDDTLEDDEAQRMFEQQRAARAMRRNTQNGFNLRASFSSNYASLPSVEDSEPPQYTSEWDNNFVHVARKRNLAGTIDRRSFRRDYMFATQTAVCSPNASIHQKVLAGGHEGLRECILVSSVLNLRHRHSRERTWASTMMQSTITNKSFGSV